jgi:cytochrome P450
LNPTDGTGRRGVGWKYLVSKLSQNSGDDLIFCRAIFHDPSIYPEPDIFKPERFLNPDGSLRDDPVLTSAFGYGKRICPGRHFVDATLFIYVASLLSVFRIENVQDGQEKQREYKYSEAIVVYVLFHVRMQ